MITRGEKTLEEVDYSGPSGLEYVRTFRGKHGGFLSLLDKGVQDLSGTVKLPGCKTLPYLRPTQNGTIPDTYCFPYIAIQTPEYHLRDAKGGYVKFTGVPAAPVATADVNDRLWQVTDAQGVATWLARRENNTLEVYDQTGLLLKSVTADGRSFTATYSSGQLTRQTDPFGRSLQWVYNPNGTVAQMVDPAGSVFDYSYDANAYLTGVTYPPDASGIRPSKTYHYETGFVAASRALYGLTGVTDENAHRMSTFAYDTQGRVTSTRLHASAQQDVNVHSFDYSQSNNTVVTDPLGNARSYAYSSIQLQDAITGVSQPAGSGSAATARAATYDTQRNATSRDDFAGRRTCYAYDLSRNLETSRVEGLSTSTTCPTNLSTYTVPNGLAVDKPQRKVTTQWHPLWRLEARRAEPGKITTTVYNGQPDPLAANAVANCAPSAPALPDGSPIAVVCKRYEQATTDATGTLGFAAVLQAGVPARSETYTYNQYGQVLTAKGPRTDVDDTTTYTYYADTTASHTLGDLASITNPAGQTTTYDKYNPHGQVLQSTDANGVVTVNTYDLRQRLTSTSVAGETTAYGYDPVGQLTSLTLPNGVLIGYTYDGAHRLTDITDAAGNTVHYTLDAAGNRTNETASDPGGALARNIARAYDALSRVQSLQQAPLH